MNHHIILRFRNQLTASYARHETAPAAFIAHEDRGKYSSDMVGFGRLRVD
jgi:hypothetical protein